MQAAYTWSKDLTDLSNIGANPTANSNDASSLSQQYGQATFVRPQRFVVNYNYDLPLGMHSGFVGKLTEGWSVSGVTLLQDGLPITIARFGGRYHLWHCGRRQSIRIRQGSDVSRNELCKHQHARRRRTTAGRK